MAKTIVMLVVLVHIAAGFVQAQTFSSGWTGNTTRAGAGGAIRLVGNAITGSCNLFARPDGPGTSVGSIRIEALTGQLLWTGSSTPSVVPSIINPEVISTSTSASLSISSIGGVPVTTDAGVSQARFTRAARGDLSRMRFLRKDGSTIDLIMRRRALLDYFEDRK